MSDERIFVHLARAVSVAVAGGFEPYADIVTQIPRRVQDELGKASSALVLRLTEHAHAEIAAHRAKEATWHERTTNDAITEAFAVLAHRHRILALENAGYTTSDGWDDVAEERRHQPKATGAVFYHGQDLERGVGGAGLDLAFGAFEGDDAATLAIARTTCQVLERHGVRTTWDGTVRSRIRVGPFEWRRRRERRLG